MPKRKRPLSGKPATERAGSRFGPPAGRDLNRHLSLHELFQQQVRQTLDQSDLDEDAKQTSWWR
jgi:hypothetical protein